MDELDDGGGGDVVLARPAPQARAASSTAKGRSRLPPLWMMWCATWFTSATSLPSRRTIMRLTSAQSSPTSARKASSDGSLRIRINQLPCAQFCLIPTPHREEKRCVADGEPRASAEVRA